MPAIRCGSAGPLAQWPVRRRNGSSALLIALSDRKNRFQQQPGPACHPRREERPGGPVPDVAAEVFARAPCRGIPVRCGRPFLGLGSRQEPFRPITLPAYRPTGRLLLTPEVDDGYRDGVVRRMEGVGSKGASQKGSLTTDQIPPVRPGTELKELEAGMICTAIFLFSLFLGGEDANDFVISVGPAEEDRTEYTRERVPPWRKQRVPACRIG